MRHFTQEPKPLSKPLSLLLVGMFLGMSASPLFSAQAQKEAQKEARKEARRAMGSPFEITAVHQDAAIADEAIRRAYDEIERIEAMISSWRESSETSAINRNAGRGPVAVSPELFGLIQRAVRVSELTGGAFDISFGSLSGLWDFKNSELELPAPEALQAALTLVDHRLIRLHSETREVFLLKPGMRIGFGAIGKGYAANRAVHILREAGMAGGLVNAGGDLVAFGQREDGSPWTVGIADPLVPDHVFARLDITEQAIVTSGDYERFVDIEGVHYAHILDPRTGWPVRGVRSVTVICPDGELADALATATFVMGVEEGLKMLNLLQGVEGLLIDEGGKIHASKNLKTRIQLPEMRAPEVQNFNTETQE